MLKTICFVLVIFLILSWLLFIFKSTDTDGTLTVDEAADSWTIAITTDPDTIKLKDNIKLTVRIKKSAKK